MSQDPKAPEVYRGVDVRDLRAWLNEQAARVARLEKQLAAGKRRVAQRIPGAVVAPKPKTDHYFLVDRMADDEVRVRAGATQIAGAAPDFWDEITFDGIDGARWIFAVWDYDGGEWVEASEHVIQIATTLPAPDDTDVRPIAYIAWDSEAEAIESIRQAHVGVLRAEGHPVQVVKDVTLDEDGLHIEYETIHAVWIDPDPPEASAIDVTDCPEEEGE